MSNHTLGLNRKNMTNVRQAASGWLQREQSASGKRVVGDSWGKDAKENNDQDQDVEI